MELARGTMNINAGGRKITSGYEALDWDHAVRVATALLDEHIPSDRATHPIPIAAAQKLAALLCAYGKLGEESDRLGASVGKMPFGQRPVAGTQTLSTQAARNAVWVGALVTGMQLGKSATVD
jgi:hypothetical protein